MHLADAQARLQALDVTNSYIVQAPAGSGKTALLVRRYLCLLAQTCQQPEEVLAITFTRKAAAEMQTRILGILAAACQPAPTDDPDAYALWQLGRAVCERSEQLQWDLLHNPRRLRIQTIDAFCAGLVQQTPIVSGVGGGFQITQDPNHLYEAAVTSFLAGLWHQRSWSSDLAHLIKHVDGIDRAKQLLLAMLPLREQWLPYIGLGEDESALRQVLEQGLIDLAEETLRAVQAAWPVGIDLLPALRFAAAHLQKASPQAWPGTQASDLAAWQDIARMCLNKSQQWRQNLTIKEGFPSPAQASCPEDKRCWQQYKRDTLACLQRLQAQEGLQAQLQAVLSLPPVQYGPEQWDLVCVLTRLLPVLVGHLLLAFRSQHQVDFSEVSLRAIQALAHLDGPSELALRLDYQIRHILMDEFQDTSYVQLRLLEHLVQGWAGEANRSLFLVGDPQQSIYRFRQAEVGIFNQVRRTGLPGVPLIPLRLSTNFRSSAAVVHTVNQLCGQIFPAPGAAEQDAIAYSPSVAHRDLAGDCQFYLVETPSAESVAIAEQVLQLRAQAPQETIAILVRKRQHAHPIMRALEHRQVAYQAHEIEHLGQRPVVQDLLALLKALLGVEDRIAWLSILRAPWCGLRLVDLEVLAADRERPIWLNLLIFEELPLSPDAKARLRVCVPIWQEALLQRDRLPWAPWLRGVWEALQGPFSLAAWGGMAAEEARAFFRVLDAVGGLDPMLGLEAQLAQRPAPTGGTSGVLIMTIHKAKGLEFDTVILPGLGYPRPLEAERLLLWKERRRQDGQCYLLWAPIKAYAVQAEPIYQYLYRAEAKSLEYESQRLLYVAMTRAKRRLYGFGHVVSEEAGPLPRSPLALLWPALPLQGRQFLSNREMPPPVGASVSLQRLHLDALRERVEVPYPPSNPLPSYNGLLAQAAWFPGARRVCYRMLLERRLDLGESLLHEEGVKGGDRPAAQAWLQAQLERLKGQWLMQAHDLRQQDVRLCTKWGGKVVTLTVRLTFVEAGQTRWLVELWDEFLEARLQTEWARLQLMAQLFQQIDDSLPIKVGVFGVLDGTWREVINKTNLDWSTEDLQFFVVSE